LGNVAFTARVTLQLMVGQSVSQSVRLGIEPFHDSFSILCVERMGLSCKVTVLVCVKQYIHM